LILDADAAVISRRTPLLGAADVTLPRPLMPRLLHAYDTPLAAAIDD